ncbi:MAG: hemolytic protein HlpA-like protein [Ignavibacteria bacterium GWA2_35_9]|nr:MAG: hemolytic protein HlpA-like protein [Ignavibacteria bacterium GWA2_35_9]OGU48246.1 MAG: hemolytic protein HlpA-like protein [Ignavibacteria bacterium GWB2_36_8]OGU50831.1 MAG: hemolytic protein HlpA-like protein [Ignavibacteria bacterium GWC2_36_12]
MSNFILNTPVAFLIFNRPETTIKVFEEIKKARPKKLFVVADGPRSNNQQDLEGCTAARKIIDTVDWDCEVLKNYSDINLGCKQRVSSGITWVFDNSEEAIFLEDDCLPHQSFFRYCQELLAYYRNDERIMMISGDNFQDGRKVTENSYYFSSYSHIWGWASWKRAWRKYDVEMKLWPAIRKSKYLDYWLSNKKAVTHWKEEFRRIYNHKINTWDFQFLFACWINQGFSILPEVNLVSNIGFGTGASHTDNKNNKASNIPVKEIHFPLKHPDFVMRNLEADIYEEENYILFSLHRRLGRRIKSFFAHA